VAVALGRDILAGLEGPGLPLVVQSVTVRDNPPRVESITVTLGG
jgi:hypothetical protein